MPKSPGASASSFAEVLLVSHEFTRSGAPIILWMLALFFKERGHAVRVISPKDGPLRAEYAREQIPAEIVPGLLTDERVAVPFLDGADVTICNSILTWRVVDTATALGHPCLWWVHETDYGIEFAATNPSISRAFATASMVVFPSQATKERYQEFSRRDNYRTLLSGFTVNTAAISSKRLLRKKPYEMHVVSVATIERRKGQDVLLAAVAALPKEIAANIHLHLIGRMRFDLPHLARLVWRSLMRPNVHLVGELPNDDVLRYLHEADVFALASRDEALPLALIEAMAFGKAIVSTNAGGIGEVIRSGENGYVVDVGDSQAFSERISVLYHNPELRDKLGKRASEDYNASHTMSNFGERMVQICEEIRVGRGF